MSNRSQDTQTVEILTPTSGNAAKWQPIVGDETLELMKHLELPDDSRDRVLEEAVGILSRCAPPTGGAHSDTGLAIGYVQSGKTMSFTTVAALARDNGFRLVIVIAGVSKPLLAQ